MSDELKAVRMTDSKIVDWMEKHHGFWNGIELEYVIDPEIMGWEFKYVDAPTLRAAVEQAQKVVV